MCAHITPEYQLKWLLDRGETHGFSINPEEVIVTKSQWQRFYKGGQRKKPVSLLAVTFEGILTVTDASRFRQTLVAVSYTHLVPEWNYAPLLQGELFLFLDEHGKTELCGYQLTLSLIHISPARKRRWKSDWKADSRH